MKKARKLTAVLLSLVMLLALVVRSGFRRGELFHHHS